MSTPITLHSFEPSDFEALAVLYRLSFFRTQLTNYILANVTPESCDKWMIERFKRIYAEKHDEGKKLECVVAKRGGECLGFGWWDFYKPLAEREAGVENERFWPEGAGTPDTIEYMERLDKADDRCEGSHWHLNVLGVHPEAQGQGVGRLLTQWGIDKAREEGADVFLVATELGRPLYSKMGFVEIGEPLIARGRPDVVTWPMILRLQA